MISFLESRRLHLWKCAVANCSALRDACRVARMPYVGVVKEVETGAVSFSGAAFPIAFSTRFSLRAD